MKYTDAITLDTSTAGRDLDYACVRACPTIDAYAPLYNDDHWNRRYWHGSVPPYSTDHAAARLLEDEIDRRGLSADYVWKLYDIVGVLVSTEGGYISVEDVVRIIRATPEQKARAFLEVVRAK